MKFTKMHGLGNDYVYVNGFEETIENPTALAPVISDRHCGVGGDGLIHIDSYGQIAVAVRGGRADETYPLSVRAAVGFRPSGTTRVPITPISTHES